MVSSTMLLFFFTILCILTAIIVYFMDRSRQPFLKSLKGKHVFITGGSSGIGLSIARQALLEGAFVTLVSRNFSKLSSVVDALLLEFQCSQDCIRFEAVDVGEFKALARAIEEAHKWKAIDVMVCNAGLIRGGYLGDGTMEDIELMMNTNVMGIVNALHTAIPLLKSRSKDHPTSIVIMGSLATLYFVYGHSVYTTTKYALRGLAESLRFELLPYNIRVSFICPGFTNTPFLDGVHGDKEIEYLMKRIHFHSRKGAESPDLAAKCTIDAVKSGAFLVTTNLLGFMLSTLGRGFTPADSWMRVIIEAIMCIPFRILSLLGDTMVMSLIKQQHLQSHREHV